ncbi:MAG: hypothetical protein VB124_04170 [Burkholderia sp.]
MYIGLASSSCSIYATTPRRSCGSRRRAPDDQMAALLPLALHAQHFDLHGQFADAMHGFLELDFQRIGLARLQTGFDACQAEFAPLFELGERDANFARHRVNRFAAQQAQDDSAFAPDGPALEFGGAGGVYGRATRALRRRQRNFLHVYLLQHLRLEFGCVLPQICV